MAIEKIIIDLIQVKRASAATWTSENPILHDGEIGFERDTNKLKIGNGTTTWNNLLYVSGSTGAETLTDLSDVGTAFVANRNMLIADGSNFKSRAATLADISNYSGTRIQTDLTSTIGHSRWEAIEVPSGGVTGQVLMKASGTNYDVTWGAERSLMGNDQVLPSSIQRNIVLGDSGLLVIAKSDLTDHVMTMQDSGVEFPIIPICTETPTANSHLANKEYVDSNIPTSPLPGSKSDFNTALTDGTFMYVGDAPTTHVHTISDITDFGTYSTDIHSNITALNAVSGVNTGDQDLTPYLTSATAASTYEPIKGPDDNYVTDAEKTVIGNISGTNTGDQTSSEVTATPYGDLTGTDVQAQLQELEDNKVKAGTSSIIDRSNQKWTLFGDSFSSLGTDDYPYYVVQKLGMDLANCESHAASGNTLNHQNTVLDGLASDYFDDKDLVTIHIGVNDFATSQLIGKIDRAAAHDGYFVSEMKYFIETIQAANPEIEIYLIAPIKIWQTTNKFDDPNNWGYVLKDYIQAMKDVAALYSLPVIDLYNNGKINDQNYVDYLDVQYVHPNSTYLPLISDIVANGLLSHNLNYQVTQSIDYSDIVKSKNLFNKETVTEGVFISNTTGGLSNNAAYNTSDFIPVEAGETYTPSTQIRFSCYFDTNGDVVSGGISSNTDASFTVPAGAVSVRVTISTAYMNYFQLEKGTETTKLSDYWVLDPFYDNLDSGLSSKTMQGAIDELAGTVQSLPAEIGFACSDESTALEVATGLTTFRMPYAMTVTEVRASLTTAGSTSGTTTIDINENGTSILSTKLTIDYGEKTSTTATTAAVISDSTLADDAEITVDIDAVTGGADEAGLKIWLIGTRI